VTSKAERAGQIVSVILWIGMFAAFGYFAYLFLQWLFAGRGTGVLLLGFFIGIIYFVFGWLPRLMSRRSGKTEWESVKTIQLFVLFIVGAGLGAYWVPRAMGVNVSWYWRVLLAFAIGWIALITRRYA